MNDDGWACTAATKAAERPPQRGALDAARNRAFHESKPVRYHRPAGLIHCHRPQHHQQPLTPASRVLMTTPLPARPEALLESQALPAGGSRDPYSEYARLLQSGGGGPSASSGTPTPSVRLLPPPPPPPAAASAAAAYGFGAEGEALGGYGYLSPPQRQSRAEPGNHPPPAWAGFDSSSCPPPPPWPSDQSG